MLHVAISMDIAWLYIYIHIYIYIYSLHIHDIPTHDDNMFHHVTSCIILCYMV